MVSPSKVRDQIKKSATPPRQNKKPASGSKLPAVISNVDKPQTPDPNLSMKTFENLQILSDKSFQKSKMNRLDANSLDDILLKKTLSDAFNADPNSYLGVLQQAVELGTALPPSEVPREYYVWAQAPLHQGFRQTEDDHVSCRCDKVD